MEIKCKNCGKIVTVHKTRTGAKYCSKRCMNIQRTGVKRTEEFKKKVSLGMKGINTWAKGKKLPQRSGVNCHFWKGGVSQQNRTERQNFTRTIEYIEFRRAVLKRDNYTCQICRARTKVGKKIILQIDHIKPYLLFPELRMDFNNVRTLCKPCHYKTDTYGAKVYKYKNVDNSN